MEFTVEIGDGVTALSAPVQNPSTPSNPAQEAVAAEHKDIAGNPHNPRHAGYLRGEKSVMDHLEKIYQGAYPGTAPIDEGVSVTTGGPDDVSPALSPEDAQSVEVLRQEWGDSFETQLLAARVGSSRLTQVLGASVDDLTAAVLDAGGDLKLILKIASHFEHRMRGHEQGSRP
jgi:hypothetical protein